MWQRDVDRVEFSPDTFRQMLEAMDGYWRLPTPLEMDGGVTALPGFPDISRSSFYFHYLLAVDKGFIKEYVGPEEVLQEWPERLTYAGKLFLDETKEPSIWQKVKPHMTRYGIRGAEELAKHLVDGITATT